MLDINHFLDEVKIINQAKNNDPAQVLHIILCFDDGYAMPAGINIVSILNNNKNSLFHFHLFVKPLSPQSIDQFKQIDSTNASITVYEVNQHFQINEENTASFPVSACVRLIAPLILHDIPYLLYLDSDMLCVGNLLKIKEIDISSVIMGVVVDLEKMQHTSCQKFGLRDGEYFNSGLMYINTKQWCEHHVTEKTLKLLNSGIHYSFPDQDVLNVVIGHNKRLIDKKFHRITELSPRGREDEQWENDSVIIHYTTGHKPWYQLFLTPTYEKYWQLSPWKNQKLLFTNDPLKNRSS